MNSYLDGMRRYADFRGRSTRSQYWLFVLVLFLLLMVAATLDVALGFDQEGALVIAGLVNLAHLVPSIAVTVRRLHDSDHSGWWMLIAFVPLVGLIVLIVFLLKASTAGANSYGPDPSVQPHASGGSARGRQTLDSDRSLDRLEKLASLRASGTIDEAEFQRMKADLLGQTTR